MIKGKIAWGFIIEKEEYGATVNVDLDIKGKDIVARREIKGKITNLMNTITKHMNLSIQKIITGKNEIEDEIEMMNKLFENQGREVKK